MAISNELRIQIWERDGGICQHCQIVLINRVDYYEEALEELGEITEIPIYKWKNECWKCQKETDVVSYDFVFLNNHSIGDIKEIDEELMKIYPFVKEKYSYTQKRKVIANTCIHCGALQGNFFIAEDLLFKFNEEGPENLIDRTIPNIISVDNLPIERSDDYVFKERNTKFGHVHHMDCNPKNNDPKNLILLCRDCHTNTHVEIREKEKVK